MLNSTLNFIHLILTYAVISEDPLFLGFLVTTGEHLSTPVSIEDLCSFRLDFIVVMVVIVFVEISISENVNILTSSFLNAAPVRI